MYHINDTQNILVFFINPFKFWITKGHQTKLKGKKKLYIKLNFSLKLPFFSNSCLHKTLGIFTCVWHAMLHSACVHTTLRIEMWTVNGDNYPPIKISYKGIDLFLKGYVTITINDKCFVTQLEYISILIGIYIYLNWYIYNQL